jgi:hypothetical protein
MNFVRKIANSDLLAGIINIPQSMRHKKVEIIVLTYEEEGNENQKTVSKMNVKGLLQKYANVNYLPLEQSAWKEAVRESHENS